MADAYTSLGASASKAGLHDALSAAGIQENSRLFAQITDDLAGDREFASFIHCDGAGTKSVVAYLRYKETKDINVFAGLAVDALVMNSDDIFCLGKPERLVLANMIARNARLVGDDVLRVLFESYNSIIQNLAKHGVSISLSGGETADCGDVVRTLLVDAIVTGRIAKKNIIHPDNIVPGDVIVGLSSTGQASYESAPNSGIGSNGLTLARHALLKSDYAKKYPEVVDPGLESKLTYRGPFSLSDAPPGLGMNIGEALSSPTRTYAPVLSTIYDKLGSHIHGVIHVTGGGLTKVSRFGRGNRYIKDNLFPMPSLFGLIHEHGKVPLREMYQVFNMGHRIEIYLPETQAQTAIDCSKKFNIDAQIIGRVEKSSASDNANSIQVCVGRDVFDY